MENPVSPVYANYYMEAFEVQPQRNQPYGIATKRSMKTRISEHKRSYPKQKKLQ